MWAPNRITLHNFRWPYAAARASVYLVLVMNLALDDPGYPGRPIAFAASAKPYERLNRDIVIRIWPYDSAKYGIARYRELNPDSRLVFEVERGIPIRYVRKALREASEAGFRRVTIHTHALPWRRFQRRLDYGLGLYVDLSVLQEPPEPDGHTFSLDGMWH